MYELSWERGGSPFNYDAGVMRDRRGCVISLYSGVDLALTELANEKKWQGVSVAVASCCDVPPWAFELLGKFEFGPKKTKMNESWIFFVFLGDFFKTDSTTMVEITIEKPTISGRIFFFKKHFFFIRIRFRVPLNHHFGRLVLELFFHSRKSKELITISQIHKGGKQGHLREIQSVVGCNFEEMIFFDNEPYNCQQVAGLGTEAQSFLGCFFSWPVAISRSLGRSWMLQFEYPT